MGNEIVQSIGLLQGELFRKNSRSFVFANSNPTSIKLIFDFLKKFAVPKRKISTYIEICGNNVNENLIKNYWRNKIPENVPIKKIRVRKEFVRTAHFGTLHVLYNSILFFNFVQKLIEFVADLAEKNKHIAIEYLKGIIAAEGNVNIKKKTKCVYMVRISAKEKKIREHYKRCLRRIGIKIKAKDMETILKEDGIKLGWKTVHGRAGAVLITTSDNFLKLLQMNIFELDQLKKEKFIKGFIKLKFLKPFFALLPFINKKFTRKDFIMLGYKRGRLMYYGKLGFIKNIGIKSGSGHPFLYKLSEKFSGLFQILRKEGVISLGKY